MKVVFKDSFVDRLEKQIDYISIDSPPRARKFKNDLLNRVKEISKNPFRYRKSIYFNTDNVRDLIFKGYTIVFRINNDTIEVFGLVKYQNTPLD